MSLDPNRIRTEYHVWSFVALDTFSLLAERIQEMLSHGRQVTLVTRWIGRDETPKVIAGLAVHEVSPWPAGLGVHLKPGINGFSLAADDATEAEVRRRFDRGARNDITEAEIHGGTHGPGREDQIIIRHWNVYGVGEETVVAFDLGDAR